MTIPYRNQRIIVANPPIVTQLFNRKSIGFNGTNENASAGNVLDKNGDSHFTVTAWFKTSNTSSTSQYVISKMEASPTLKGWGMRVKSSRIEMLLYNGGPEWSVQSTGATYADGNWHFAADSYAGTRDVSGHTLFIDGAVSTTNTIGNDLATDFNNSGPLIIGSRDGPSNWLTGLADELAVWGTDLTPAQMSMVYRARDLRELPFAHYLQGYWSGDGSDGSLMPDYSGNGYNGTPQNMDASNYTTDVHTPT